MQFSISQRLVRPEHNNFGLILQLTLSSYHLPSPVRRGAARTWHHAIALQTVEARALLQVGSIFAPNDACVSL
jgi:hypothetical protein